MTRCLVQSFTIDSVQYQKAFQLTVDQPCFKFRYFPKASGRVKGRLII